jgi:CMP-N-acetylneuraminic acid synthetase
MLPDHTKVIALIPARSGSKGIKFKNLALLQNRPLLTYRITAALRSKIIDDVWVSSDDIEIIRVAEASGVKTLLRPFELASDTASATVVVEHFISALSGEVLVNDVIIVYLQPTSPLRSEIHIDTALHQMYTSGLPSLISVVKADKSPYKAFKLNTQNVMESLFDEHLSNARRQDLPECYYPNGAIYAFRSSLFIAHGGFPSNGSLPFIMNSNESIDIDTIEDLERAEIILGGLDG